MIKETWAIGETDRVIIGDAIRRVVKRVSNQPTNSR